MFTSFPTYFSAVIETRHMLATLAVRPCDQGWLNADSTLARRSER